MPNGYRFSPHTRWTTVWGICVFPQGRCAHCPLQITNHYKPIVYNKKNNAHITVETVHAPSLQNNRSFFFAPIPMAHAVGVSQINIGAFLRNAVMPTLHIYQ